MYPSVHTPMQAVRGLFRARRREIWRARRMALLASIRDGLRPAKVRPPRVAVQPVR